MAQPFVQTTNSFTSPPDWQAQQADIQRRMALAQQLTNQGLDTSGDGTKMVGQVAIPNSWTQGLAKALKGGLGLYEQQKLSQEQRDLYQQQQGVYAQAGNQLMNAVSPRPAQPAQDGVYDEVGGINQPATAAQPAYTPSMDDVGRATMKYLSATGHNELMPQVALAQAQRQAMMAQLLQPDQAAGGAQPPAAAPPSQGAADAGQPGTPTSAPAPAAGGSGTIGGIPQALAARLIAADPTGKTLAEAQAGLFKQQQAPINVRQGGTVFMPGQGPIFSAPVNGIQTQYGPQGPSASPLPGYLPAATAITAGQTVAKAAAEAPYQTVEVPQRGGGTMPTFKPQVPGYGGAAPTAPQPQAAPPAPAPRIMAGGQPIPPAEAPAANAVLNATAQGQPMTVPGVDPWASMPKLLVPQGAGPQGTMQKTLAEEQGKKAAELSTKYGQAAADANQRMATNNQALDLIDQADTGPGSSFMTDFKNLAVSRLGIPEGDFQNNPAANTALNKDLVNSAVQKGKSMFGSRFTQSEVGLMLTQASPSAQQTKTAIKFLLQSDNANQQYSIKQANDLGRFMASGGDPMRFEAWYSGAFPQTNALSQVKMTPQTGAALPAGIPTGSNPVGKTPDGRVVYKAPDGKNYVP